MQTTSLPSRIEKLRQIIRQAGLDFAALVPGANFFYLTGVRFHLMERPLIVLVPVEGDPAVIVPGFEAAKLAEAEPFPFRAFSYSDTEGHLPAFEQACKALGLAGKRIGVEGLLMRVVEGQLLQRYAPGCTLESADDTLMRLRINKDAAEVSRMRQAISISQAALDAILPAIHPGLTELQVMKLLKTAMFERGSEGDAFNPIVLSGPNSALPHGVPSDRVLREGDLLLFDFGSMYQGYPADITRTFAIGPASAVDPELIKVYDIVKAANEAGRGAARPGIAAQEVDRAARKVIEAAGYGPHFNHRTGHGLGLDVHEGPYMREGNTQVLEPGMIFTVEPGVYLSGRGGVRIEDNVVITTDGAESLTTYPREFRVVG